MLIASIVLMTIAPSSVVIRTSILNTYSDQMNIDAKYIMSNDFVEKNDNLLLYKNNNVIDCIFLRPERLDSKQLKNSGFRPSIITMLEIKKLCEEKDPKIKGRYD